jgi:CHAT domain-containing protein
MSMRNGFLADKRQVYDLLMKETARDHGVSAETRFRMIEQTHSRALQDKTKAGTVLSLATLQKSLPLDTLLLDYWLGEDAAAVVWATSQEAGAQFVHDERDLRTRLRKFAESLTDTASNRWTEDARKFGALLLPTIAGAESIRHVIVIPDRELSAIPFEVFPLPGSTTYRLIDRAAVSYSRAAMASKSARGKQPVWPFWRSTLLAFANPVRGEGADLMKVASPRFDAALQGADDEVRDVARAIGGRTALHIGVNARKEYLTDLHPRRMPVLHFATHAFSDAEDPARSYILLAPERASGAYDYLFLKEASALDLREVDLVTVSACDSARGRLIEGEGVQSFGGAFLDAGAKSVVASLWQVGDQSTSRLMHEFYSLLAQGAPVAESLRNAKLQTLRAGQMHPYYWAGFVVSGDGQVQIPYVVSGFFTAAAGLGILGVTLFGVAALRSRLRSGPRVTRITSD